MPKFFYCQAPSKDVRRHHCYLRELPQCRECQRFECKHDKGFQLDSWSWHCQCLCGFRLNFDPTKFPGGIATLEEPNPRATKVLPKWAFSDTLK